MAYRFELECKHASNKKIMYFTITAIPITTININCNDKVITYVEESKDTIIITFDFPNKLIHIPDLFKNLEDNITNNKTEDINFIIYHKYDERLISIHTLHKKGNLLFLSHNSIICATGHIISNVIFKIDIEINKSRLINMLHEVNEILSNYIKTAITNYVLIENAYVMTINDVKVIKPVISKVHDIRQFLYNLVVYGTFEFPTYKNKCNYIGYRDETFMLNIHIIYDEENNRSDDTQLTYAILKNEYINIIKATHPSVTDLIIEGNTFTLNGIKYE